MGRLNEFLIRVAADEIRPWQIAGVMVLVLLILVLADSLTHTLRP